MTKHYIFKRAAELNTVVPSNYLDILKEIIKSELSNGIYIKISWLYNCNKFINANAFFGKIILLNPEWATCLILYKDNDLENAFNITIGHELTHKDKHLCSFRLSKKKEQFMAWVNEVYADFGAAEKRAGASRQKLLDSIKYKKERHPTEDSQLHPSWERRKHYVENFDFEPLLIEQIAKDVGYHNQKFIDKVKSCGLYKNINLV